MRISYIFGFVFLNRLGRRLLSNTRSSRGRGGRTADRRLRGEFLAGFIYQTQSEIAQVYLKLS
jgi:hypothetical protein